MPGAPCFFGGALLATGPSHQERFVGGPRCDIDDDNDGIAVFGLEDAAVRWVLDSGKIIPTPGPWPIAGGGLLAYQPTGVRLWPDVVGSDTSEVLLLPEHLRDSPSGALISHGGLLLDFGKIWFVDGSHARTIFDGEPNLGVADLVSIGHPDRVPGFGITVQDIASGVRGAAWVDGSMALDEPLVDRVFWPPEIARSQPLAVGDLNGDGTLDLVIGSDLDIDGTKTRIDVFFDASRGRDLLDSDVKIVGFGMIHNEAEVGDFDGDGHDDLVVSNPRNVDGYIMIFRGPLQPGEYEPDDADLIFTVEGNKRRLGIQMAVADVNNDGRDELAVTKWDNSGNGGNGESVVYVFEDVLAPWTAANTP